MNQRHDLYKRIIWPKTVGSHLMSVIATGSHHLDVVGRLDLPIRSPQRLCGRRVMPDNILVAASLGSVLSLRRYYRECRSI